MAGGIVTPSGKGGNNVESGNYTFPLVIITNLFFMWGFITCLNDILIPKFQDHFHLDGFKAMLVQFAFFSAYFLVSLAYFIMSTLGIDPIAKYGYKKAIIAGLAICGIGCLMFYPAAGIESYNLFLVALFVLASGVTVLQMGANPYVTLLGSADSASSRLNMTQAFNSLGTTIAPVIGGGLILGTVGGLETVQGPYLFLAAVLFAMAAVIYFIPLPTVVSDHDKEGHEIKGIGAWNYSHLVLGVVCIFFYVGGEVSIGSAVIKFLGLENIAGLPAEKADKYLSFYWGGAMIGRFLGAVLLDDDTKLTVKTVILIIAILGLADLLGIFLMNKDIILGNAAEGTEWDLVTPEIFEAITIVNLLAFFIGKKNPGFTLGVFATIVVGLLTIGIIFDKDIAMWSILSIGLFNSIMFPTIFTLAIRGLGIDTSQGASLLVMAIVGGAIIPPIQGLLYGENNSTLQFSFIVPLVCYAYIAFYGFIGSKPKKVAEKI